MAKKTKLTKIEEDIFAVTKTKQRGAKESDQTYWHRLATACQEIDDDEWNKLKNKTQVWCNGAIQAIKDENDIDAPDDSIGDDDDTTDEGDDSGETEGEGEGEAADDEADNDNETAEDEPAPRRRRTRGRDEEPETKPKSGKNGKADKGKADAKPNKGAKAGKASKDEPTTKKRGPRPGGGAQATLKMLMIEDPARTTEQLVDGLKEKGLIMTPLAASTIRSGMMQTLRLLHEAGKLKGVKLP